MRKSFWIAALGVLGAFSSPGLLSTEPPVLELVFDEVLPRACAQSPGRAMLGCLRQGRYRFGYENFAPRETRVDLTTEFRTGSSAPWVLGYRITEASQLFFGAELLKVLIEPASGNPDGAPVPHLVFPGYRRVSNGDKGVSYYRKGFRYLTVAESGQRFDRTLEFPGLDVLKYQNVHVEGNDVNLSDGETSWLVAIAAPLAPALLIEDEVDVANLGAGAPRRRALWVQMRELFSHLLGDSGNEELPLSYEVSYVYEILPQVEVVLPVATLPLHAVRIPFDWSPEAGCDTRSPGSGAEVCRVADLLRLWYMNTRPPGEGARFRFKMNVHNPIGTGSRRPLLSLDRLELHLRDIVDLDHRNR